MEAHAVSDGALPAPGTFLTPRQFAEKYTEFSLSSLRWSIHCAEQNGLAKSGAIIRKSASGTGKRHTIWLDVPKFFAWFRS